jgi:hypothetical protein
VKKLGQEIRAGVGAWLEAGMVVAKGVGAGLGLSTSIVDEETPKTTARPLLEDGRAASGAL